MGLGVERDQEEDLGPEKVTDLKKETHPEDKKDQGLGDEMDLERESGQGLGEETDQGLGDEIDQDPERETVTGSAMRDVAMLGNTQKESTFLIVKICGPVVAICR